MIKKRTQIFIKPYFAKMENYKRLAFSHNRFFCSVSKFYNFILFQMLKSSMLAAQAAQLKELDAMFERDNKEMKSTQAKVLVPWSLLLLFCILATKI